MAARTISIEGRVVAGTGRMAAMMSAGPRAHFYAINFGHLEPGTLNVQLGQPYTLRPEMVFPRDDQAAPIMVERCQVENLPGFILQAGDMPRPEGLLHIVSPFPLRRYLLLRDNSAVRLKLTAPAQPSNSKGRQ